MNFATRISQLLISALFACAGAAHPVADLSAAEGPGLRVVYNALGGSMAPVQKIEASGFIHSLYAR